MGKRLLACALLLALLLPAFAAAEEVDSQALEDAALVEALFAAVAGTTTESEKTLREDMTEEELLARNTENVAWRQLTRPWLMEALRMEPEEEPQPTLAPEEAAESFDPQPVFDAFAGRETGAIYRALLATGDAAQALELTRAACRRWLEQIDVAYLKEINEEYACWIYCPDSQIDYPIAQGDDNSYYLHRLLNGEVNDCGTLFIDYRNLADFQDPNTLIYGHHMRNGSMFKSITFYEEQAYFEAHPYMLIVTPEKCWLLEMFAGYLTTKDDHCYDIAISDAEDMREFVETAQKKSNFTAQVPVQPGNRLVTLSTCAYAFERARYIAIGRMELIGPVADAAQAEE